MKKHFYLFSTILLTATIFLSAPAKAEERNQPQQNDCGNSNQNDNKQVQSPEQSKSSSVATSPAQLPINNGIVFLMFAGVVIGITTVAKGKQNKLAAVKA